MAFESPAPASLYCDGPDPTTIDICINNTIIGVEDQNTYAQIEGERRSIGGPA